MASGTQDKLAHLKTPGRYGLRYKTDVKPAYSNNIEPKTRTMCNFCRKRMLMFMSRADASLPGSRLLLSWVWALPASPPTLAGRGRATRRPRASNTTRQDGYFEQGRDARLEGVRLKKSTRSEGG